MYERYAALVINPTDPTQRLLVGVLTRAFPGLRLDSEPAEPTGPPGVTAIDSGPPAATVEITLATDRPPAPPGMALPTTPAYTAIFLKDEGTRATTRALTTLRERYPDAFLCVSGATLKLPRRRTLTACGVDAFCDLSVPGDLGRAVDLTQRALELMSFATLTPELRRNALNALAARRDPQHHAAA